MKPLPQADVVYEMRRYPFHMNGFIRGKSLLGCGRLSESHGWTALREARSLRMHIILMVLLLRLDFNCAIRASVTWI